MKPLAVFAMPKDPNKTLNPRATGNRGNKRGFKKVDKGAKKKGSEEPKLS